MAAFLIYMATTKSDILTRVAAYANGAADLPTGDQLTQWGEFLESANQEWTTAYDPQVMIKTLKTTGLQSGTSVAIPADFKEKFAGYVSIEGDLYREFGLAEATIADIDSHYVGWHGNPSDGYYMSIYPALYSTCAINIPYHSRPTSLATLTSVSPIPEPEFLVQRVTEHVLIQRGSPEYVEFQARANMLLARMIERDNTSDLQRDKTIRTQAEYNGFQLGED